MEKQKTKKKKATIRNKKKTIMGKNTFLILGSFVLGFSIGVILSEVVDEDKEKEIIDEAIEDTALKVFALCRESVKRAYGDNAIGFDDVARKTTLGKVFNFDILEQT